MGSHYPITLDYSGVSPTYNLRIYHHNGTSSTLGGNYYAEVGIRGWSNTRNNSHDARPNNYIDYRITIDICGWETVVAPATLALPAETTYYIEVGTNRSNTTTYNEYWTDSSLYPAGLPSAQPTWAGQIQCDIIDYTLTGTETPLTDGYTVFENSRADGGFMRHNAGTLTFR